MKNIFTQFKKQFIIMSVVIVVSIVTSTYFIQIESSRFLVNENLDKLDTIKYTLKNSVENYFKSTKNILLTFSNSKTVKDALIEFESSFEQLDEENIALDKTAMYKYIDEFISNVSYDMPLANKKREKSGYIPKTKTAKFLQENYLYKNPFGQNERCNLLESKQNNRYDKAHKKYHPYFFKELKQYDFYDVFLIDNNGNIVYSVFKENDFASNLLDGIYKDSSLSLVYKKAEQSLESTVVFEDFKPYEASYNQPASFLATPIFKDGKKIGVLAIQISIKKINQLMHVNNAKDSFGFENTGETYLVGKDMLMRSDSRFIKEIDNKFVKKFFSTVGIVKVDTNPVKQAFKGENSNGLFKNYRNRTVYSSFTFIDVFNEKWAILTEIEKREIDKNISQSTTILLVTSSIIFIIFIVLLFIMFEELLLKPILKNEELLNENLMLQNRAFLTSESLLNEYIKIIDMTSIVSRTNKNGIITYVNDAFCELSGYSRAELVGRSHNIIRHPDMPKKTFKELWKTIKSGKIWKGIIKNRKKDGSSYYVNSTITPILDENKNILEFISMRTDVTDLVLKEETLLKQKFCIITSLPNRLKLFEDLESISAGSKLASVSMSNYMYIIDSYGKDIAQTVLKKFAEKLNHLLYEKDISIYKIGDYEFALLVSKEDAVKTFENMLKEIVNYFDKELILLENRSYNINLNIGLANNDTKRAFINSQTALRKAVELSKSLIVYENSSELYDNDKKNIDMITKIKEAIKNDKILVYIQSIYSNKSVGKIKYECLVRLDDNGEILTPFYFLEIAKKARLYQSITHIVIEKSFKYFKDKDFEFSINLTIADILNEETVSFLKKKIQEYNIGNRLVIEIVESEGIEQFNIVNDFIISMKSYGCKIAIDDFGTGYSNFEYLMKLNIDYIKIDGSLIKNIHIDTDAQMVVDLIVNFAKRFDIDIIAEYIHNKEVQDKVVELDIQYSQGYYIEKPKAIPYK